MLNGQPEPTTGCREAMSPKSRDSDLRWVDDYHKVVGPFVGIAPDFAVDRESRFASVE
jgi:hypothetical protein